MALQQTEGAQPAREGGSAAADALPRPFGKYLLMRKLAAGGMAELFLALHRSVAGFEKLVVIKRILPLMNQDRQFIDMLLHEARVAATLSHPNVVQTFDVGQAEGTYFIAMEHIHGEDIRTIVRQMKAKSLSEFPIEHALHIVVGLCAGLAYAHEKRDLEGKLLGIVHRDISPQNIVLTFSGDVKVVDFGVAKSLHAGEDSKGGHLKGKVPYMSPEQATGEEVDSRSDVFAAGVILFELTTGKRLFKGPNEYETLKLICESEYPMPSDVAPGYPAELERIVMKALSKSREGRYQSAREMQADLEAFIRHERIPVSPVNLAAWMGTLFAEKLDEQKSDLMDIKLLADQLAASLPAPEFSPASTGTHAAFDQSSTGAGAPPAAASIAPPQKRGAGVFVGGVVALAAIAGVVFVATREPAVQPAPGAAEDAAPATAPVVVEERGALRIESDPSGAAIWLNGDLRSETTPFTIENLPLGKDILVKVSMEGFESHKETIKLEKAGDARKLVVKLLTGSVTVELDVVPEPLVWIDGKPWKGEWKKLSVSADEEHKIAVSASGYAPKTFTFTAKKGETKKFQHALVKLTPEQLAAQNAKPDKPTSTGEPKVEAPKPGAMGTIRVNAKGGFCNVSINGAAHGPTPVVAQVPAGNVRVSCKPESGPSQATVVQVPEGGTGRASFQIGG
jgi:eukaryotic-like serine/threonine-protein kinase